MNIVIAIDSLKGSLSSFEAGKAIEEGIRKVYNKASIVIRPIADGGEGTVEALTLGMNGKLETVTVTGPLGKTVEAVYGILQQSETRKEKTAIIEISSAAGITLISENERNPLKTTTYGVGEIIKDAIAKGCRHFIIGIGGSATNDGGIGMLQSLGFGLLDNSGNQVKFGAEGLSDLCKITDENAIPELKECTFRIACDVTNTLCGKYGASAVYGRQKGATSEMIINMDKWLEAYAFLSRKKYDRANINTPGTGAAGGLGFAFLTFTNSVLESGIKIVLEETALEEYIKNTDIVITGEGKLDNQTAMGKAPIGVASIAKKYNKPVIAFSGCVEENAKVCNDHGIDAFFPIIRNIVSLSEAMDSDNSKKNMTDAVEQVFRLINCIKVFKTL